MHHVQKTVIQQYIRVYSNLYTPPPRHDEDFYFRIFLFILLLILLYFYLSEIWNAGCVMKYFRAVLLLLLGTEYKSQALLWSSVLATQTNRDHGILQSIMSLF